MIKSDEFLLSNEDNEYEYENNITCIKVLNYVYIGRKSGLWSMVKSM